MIMIACVLLALSILLAVGNIAGCIQAVLRQRCGDRRGYSSVPFFSLFFAVLAFWLGRPALGAWVFLPCVLDPGTWMFFFLPYLLFTEFRR